MAGLADLTDADLGFLERARAIAHGGWGRVHPNPIVGCVLVKDGVVVGEGCHEEFGGPHAEVAALHDATLRSDREPSGATAYVTLEPCNHHGKTPPCADALIEAGVRRVVFGASDPGAASAGGATTLRKGGVEVVGPAWSDAEGRAENPAFFHAATHSTPYVALKLALTLDGRIAAEPGVRTRITGAEADRHVHRLRTGHDAILVGAGTLRADDPALTVRLAEPGRVPPRRIVLDPSAKMPPDATLLRDAGTVPVHVFTRRNALESDLERLEAAGAHVHPVASGAGGLDLHEVLEVCHDIGIHAILCEGGARLAASLVREGLVQRIYLFVAPFVLGEKGLPAFADDAASLPWDRFSPVLSAERHGRDTLIVLDKDQV